MYEETGTETALDTTTQEVNGNVETGGLFPNTPAPVKPTPKPQAHRARITGVTVESGKDSGVQYLKVGWNSLETAQDDSLMIFPPQAFIDNVLIDPSKLSKEQPIRDDGTKGASEYSKFCRTIRNTKVDKQGEAIPDSGDATVQVLVRYAIAQGQIVSLPTPRTFAQFGEYLNQLLTGTQVVALMRAQGGDGDFSDRLRTVRFTDQESADNPKFLKEYRKLWQE